MVERTPPHVRNTSAGSSSGFERVSGSRGWSGVRGESHSEPAGRLVSIPIPSFDLDNPISSSSPPQRPTKSSFQAQSPFNSSRGQHNILRNTSFSNSNTDSSSSDGQHEYPNPTHSHPYHIAPVNFNTNVERGGGSGSDESGAPSPTTSHPLLGSGFPQATTGMYAYMLVWDI